MDGKRVNEELAALIEAWCERRELGALAGLLPAYLRNNGLTDGWEDLCSTLHSMSGDRGLPPDERDTLKRLWVQVDFALRNR